MKNDYLLDSLGAIDAELIEETGDQQPAGVSPTRRRRRFIRAAAAVIAALMIGGAVLLIMNSVPTPKPASINLLYPIAGFDRNVVASYKYDMAKAEGKEVDFEFNYEPDPNTKCVLWMPFFMHEGRLYWKSLSGFSTEKYKGEKVLSVKSLHRDWPNKYLEGEGQTSGDFYEVKGYDPEFMLCTPNRDYPDELDVYICGSGYSVTYGKDVIEDRFHASRDLIRIRYEDSESAFHALCIRHFFRAEDKLAKKFMKALDEATWCVPYETAEQLEEMFGFDSVKWTVWLDMKDYSIVLSLFDNGYATIHHVGGYAYFLKLDEKTMKPVMEAIRNGEGELAEITDKTRGLTLESARENDKYGSLVPEYIPDGLDFEYCLGEYDVDRKTHETLGTDHLYMSFADKRENRYLNLSILEREAFEKEFDIVTIDLSEFTEEKVIQKCSRGSESDLFRFMVYKGGSGVFVDSNLPLGELMKTVNSCFR